MDIDYKNSSIRKVCTNAEIATKEYGSIMAEKINQRIGEIDAADSVEMMLQYHVGRCHKLKAGRKNQYAVDLVHPYRLVFEVHGNKIQIAKIIEIVDYH